MRTDHMTRCAPLSFRLALIASLLLASRFAAAQPGSIVPCIDTNTSGPVRQVMRIVFAGGSDGRPQAAFGTLTSWDAQTGTVGFRPAFSPEVQQLPVKSIAFSFERPPMQAQEPIPTITPFAAVSRTYGASEVTIEQGVVRLPGCIMPIAGHSFGFEGMLTFSGGAGMTVQGTFHDIEPPKGGGSGSVSSKPG
jgi:hypothetical protein